MSLYYDLYPKDPDENLEWRIACAERALVDVRFRDALWQACMEDVLFFMGFACWCVEPRAEVKVRPFVPWPHQEDVFVKIDAAIDDSARLETSVDVILDKSRAQGGTFGYLWIDMRRWLRDTMFSAGYVTRNEMLVDSATDSDTLFWKLAWGIERLPEWMKPTGFTMKQHRSLSNHSLLNPQNGSTLVGYAAGQDVGAGGRKTVFTCLASGTMVVTDRGLVPIEEVRLQDSVWDGTVWVEHGGLVYRGERETISAYGIRLTADHRVFTERGWTHAEDGYNRAEVRFPDGYQEKWCGQVRQIEVAMPMRLWESCNGWNGESADSNDKELRLLQEKGYCSKSQNTREVTDGHIQDLVADAATNNEPQMQRLQVLRCPRNYCLWEMDEFRGIPRRHGRTAEWNDFGAIRQRGALLQGQLSLGNSSRASEQHTTESCCEYESWTNDDCSDIQICGTDIFDCEMPYQEGLDGGRTLSSTKNPEAVYDLLNCGPRRAFMVIDDCGRPLLVHNCDEFGAKDFISGGKDESVMEALHDVTNCVRLVSARYADAGVFHEACEDPDHGGLHLVLDWKDNPIHARHLYMVRGGRAEAKNPEEQEAVDAYHKSEPDLRKRLERKGFKWEGVWRSPWYDMRCLRPTSTPRLIASQLDRDPRGAVGKVFSTDLLDRVKREHCRTPIWQGTPVFDGESLALKGLLTRDDGPLKLWFRPGIDDGAPIGPFVVGCDVAIGSDGAFSSNSVASVIDERTGEQVAEYTVRGMPMIKFGRVVVGLCKWLHNAYLGWEDAGMVGPFAKEILEVLYYSNVYYRDVPAIGLKRKTQKAGWWNGKDEHKSDLFEKMALGMETGEFTPRSEDLIRECGEYEWDKGKIVHQPTKNQGATEKAHGDRCVAAGVSWLLYKERTDGESIDSGEEKGETPQYGSFLWCEMRERPRHEAGSPEWGIRDVVCR